MKNKEAVGQLLLRALPFAPVSIIPPMGHIPPILNTAVISRTRGQSMGISERSSAHSGVQECWTQLYFHFVFVTGILVNI
jgi:hypothetical protein